MRNTVHTFAEAKKAGRRLALLTAYDYSTARLMDDAGLDGILVGDSLGMVSLGHPDTLAVTMEDMIHHTRAVSRGVRRALLISDMPFMSYQTSVRDAVANAGRLVKEGGAQAVKLEGGEEVCAQIRAIARAAVPVMGHIGLTPQSVHALGGYKVQGRTEEAARTLLRAARAVEEAGAFALVLECVPALLGAEISRRAGIPVIGIGAGPCDGQVLVSQDMLGMFPDFTPKFVKQYADVGSHMRDAFAAYARDVAEGAFPDAEHQFAIDASVLEKLY